MTEPVLTIRPLAESGVLVEIGTSIAPDVTARVMAITAAIDAAAVPGIIDVVPSYTTIMVCFDPSLIDSEELIATIRRIAASPLTATSEPTREVEIPARYGGPGGPDLDDVAAHAGLSAGEVIARHAGAGYVVACMGFAPGFAFLAGLPPELATPRISNPRTSIPPGTVGIGGAQTGVYPLATPGGWRLIARTPRRLFDLEREEPFLLRPGDRVRFRPIDDDEYEEIDRRERSRGSTPQVSARSPEGQ